ncbi:MAG: metal-sulfur cluster biosynthetic enzyme [Candidatus Cloacimonadota bacterium]|nr:MAG: metal-sulfur cluster biosynthetic enzyme [Candidatus Cloacimonadota bacterium]
MEKNMDFEQKAIEIIKGVEHPAINHSLYDLGIIKSYEIKENNVQIVVALPALNIPIIDMLINSFKHPLEAMQAKVEINTIVMTQEELQKFLAMEQNAWKGM